MTQYNDAKESMTLAANSTLEQLPKDVSHVIDASENVFVPLQMSEPIPQMSDVTSPQEPYQAAVVSSSAPVENVMTTSAVAAAPASSTASVAAEPQKDLEAASPTKVQPVRKISRFLVSPAILTVANEKSVQSTCVEGPLKSPPPTMGQPNLTNMVTGDVHSSHNQQIQQSIPHDDQLRTQQQQHQQQLQISTDMNQQTVIDLSKQMINTNSTEQPYMNASNVLNVPTQLSGKIAEFIEAVQPEGAPFINPTDIISQSNAMETKEFIQQQLKKPLGPDHINTLEQLKIELENITHVHMMTKFLSENDGSSSQLSPDMSGGNQQMIDGM